LPTESAKEEKEGETMRYGILAIGLCLSVGLYTAFDIGKFIGVILIALSILAIEYRLEKKRG